MHKQTSYFIVCGASGGKVMFLISREAQAGTGGAIDLTQDFR